MLKQQYCELLYIKRTIMGKLLQSRGTFHISNSLIIVATYAYHKNMCTLINYIYQ